MKVVTVVGARPQFIKTTVVSRALRALPGVREVLATPPAPVEHNPYGDGQASAHSAEAPQRYARKASAG